MPSGGLNIDQMCQAVQATGVSPNLFGIHSDYNLAMYYLYSSIKSGFAPVIIIKDEKRRSCHAITASGMKLATLKEEVGEVAQVEFSHQYLLGLYIHDDRLGPYLRADLKKIDVEVKKSDGLTKKNVEKLQIEIPLRHNGNVTEKETWNVTHVLVPMHSKIRLSFDSIFTFSKLISNMIDTFMKQVAEEPHQNGRLEVDSWISKSHQYVENLILDSTAPNSDRVWAVSNRIALARYIGIIRVSGEFFSSVDVVFDTTSTKRNTHLLGVVIPKLSEGYTELVAKFLSQQLKCPLVN